MSQELLEVSSIVSSAAAAIGLVLVAYQMMLGRRAGVLQALQNFSGEVAAREAALHDTDDAKRLRAFHEFLNFLEFYAHACNERLIVGGSARKMVEPKLLDSWIVLEGASAWHEVFESAIDRPSTFEELFKFLCGHEEELERRGGKELSLLKRLLAK